MSYAKVHTALFTSSLFNGTSGVGEFGDNVQELDWSIGKLMDALEENGFLNNTMVIFTSDNGPFLEEGLEVIIKYIIFNITNINIYLFRLVVADMQLQKMVKCII